MTPAIAAVSNVGLYQQDFERAVFYRRSTLSGYAILKSGTAYSQTNNSDNSELDIEQRWYAHRVYKHLLVHEIEWRDPSESPCLSVSIGLPFSVRSKMLRTTQWSLLNWISTRAQRART